MDERHGADPAVLRRVRQELERLYGDRLAGVLLYGSRARGDARPDSDYDLAVLLHGYEGASDEYERLLDLQLRLEEELGSHISARPFAPDEIDRRTAFMRNLRLDAVRL